MFPGYPGIQTKDQKHPKTSGVGFKYVLVVYAYQVVEENPN